MAAYIASARIDRGRPLVARPAASLREAPDRSATAAAVDEWILDTSPPGQQEIELRWAGVRERWSQLWFYVLDPESWR
jgi:hypothetical protein